MHAVMFCPFNDCMLFHHVLQLIAVESERTPGTKLSLTLCVRGKLDFLDTAARLRSIPVVVGVAIPPHGI
jgi:hypothetical protein